MEYKKYSPPIYPRHARHFVIGECGHVILQHFRVLGDDVRRGAILFVALQLIVSLYDVTQLMRQIVLRFIRICMTLP